MDQLSQNLVKLSNIFAPKTVHLNLKDYRKPVRATYKVESPTMKKSDVTIKT